MKNKIIFELKLNSKDSLVAYEKNNYNTCYEDSLLYINVAGKKIKIAESSFCYGFGLEMYYRIYNLKEYYESSNFAELYADCLSNATYDEEWFKSRASEICYDYDFANGKLLNDFISLFLLKNRNGIKLLIVKLWECEHRKYKAEILNEFQISESMFEEWKTLISTEWGKRVVIEGNAMARANECEESTKEEWEQYFLFMRSDNKINNPH